MVHIAETGGKDKKKEKSFVRQYKFMKHFVLLPEYCIKTSLFNKVRSDI